MIGVWPVPLFFQRQDEGRSLPCLALTLPLDSGSELRSTSSIHGVVPEGEQDRVAVWLALFAGPDVTVAEVGADAAQALLKKNNERDKLYATPSGKQQQTGYYCFRHKSEKRVVTF